METENRKAVIREKLMYTYFLNTHEEVNDKDYTKYDFLNKIREDVCKYLVDKLDINADELVFSYFFNIIDIKELIDLYFEVNKIKVKDLKRLQKANIKFTLKHIDTLPYFCSNVFCKIADELAFYISRYVDM